MKALEGIKVCDFSHVMAGPFCSYYLALMGADVTKIEPPGAGDPFRVYGPDRRYDGMSAAFIAINVGKRSIVLDLKKPEGQEIVRKLIAASDVVVENFRPGVIDRLGFGYEACKTLKNDIIFCSVSGYGQKSPLRDYPAIDNVVQAASGMTMQSGLEGGGPVRIGFAVVDTWTGMTAAYAVMSALFRRARTGEGQYIDASMMDSAVAFMTSSVASYLVTGKVFPRTGNVGYSGQPTAGVFKTADGGYISLGVVQNVEFANFAKALGHPEWAQDPRFGSPGLRKDNEAAITRLVADVIKTKDGETWERELNAVGAPCALVRNTEQVVAMDHFKDRNLFIPVNIPGLPDKEDVSVLNAGFSTNEDGPGVQGRPPRHGEHTREVLGELGYQAEEIDTLVKGGVVFTPQDEA
ncbi:MAG: CoA transferase [Caulobacteraceae bacterium]|nr:MAG: CoA transferase [Caulobacteraceae bacterium]